MIGGSASPGWLPEGLAAGGDVEMAQDLANSSMPSRHTRVRVDQAGGDIRDLESRSPCQGHKGQH